ncbi:MAG TPA: hypothetical protein VF332_03310 [Vicinamibacterales bacterium]
MLAVVLLTLFAAVTGVWAQPMAPSADPKAIVVSGQARFTVLTPRMIRMEWSEARNFEDRASLAFINRKQPVPSFTAATKAGWLPEMDRGSRPADSAQPASGLRHPAVGRAVPGDGARDGNRPGHAKIRPLRHR